MIGDLLDTVATVVSGLFTGLTYERKGEALPVAMDVHTGALPIKDKDTAGDEAVPFVLVKPGPFQLGRPQDTVGAVVTGAVYTSGDIADGIDVLGGVLAVLNGLKSARYDGYKLMLPVTGTVGDQETGINPHPYYHFELNLTFRKEI